jgi:hypothetical protein
MVLCPFNLHFVTAPPAPSPKLPSSMILFSRLTIFQPSSSSSSTSAFLALSRVASSKLSSDSPSTSMLSLALE